MMLGVTTLTHYFIKPSEKVACPPLQITQTAQLGGSSRGT